jgi:hypothetical protein
MEDGSMMIIKAVKTRFGTYAAVSDFESVGVLAIADTAKDALTAGLAEFERRKNSGSESLESIRAQGRVSALCSQARSEAFGR